MLRPAAFALAVAALAALASPALAQEDEASNVTPYPRSFFTEFRPNTARDMINRLPGFSFVDGGNARGFAGNAGNVLIDGERPPSRGDSLGDILGRIPASAVERIDLIRGGADGIDMQGRAIIANIIRRPDGGLTGSALASVDYDNRNGLDRRFEATAQHQAGGRVFEGSVSHFTSDDYGLERRIREDVAGVVTEHGLERRHGHFEIAEAKGSAEFALLGGQMRANGQLTLQHYGSDNVEDLLIPSGFNSFQDVGQRTAGEAGVRYTRNLPADFSMEVIGFQSLYDRESQDQSTRPAFRSGGSGDEDGGESIGSIALHSPAYGAWRFDGGTEVAYNWVESFRLRTINGAPLSLSGDQSRVEELRNDTHLVAIWSPSSTLNVEAGARYERSTITAGPVEKTLNFLKPRVNISWTPKAGHQFGLRAERIVDQLSFGSFQSSVNFNSTLGNTIFGVGNNELEPTHQWLFEGRYEHRFGREGVFVAQVTHRRIEDFAARTVVPAPTATDPNRTFEITANVGDAERTNYSVDATLPLDRYGLEGGLFKLGFDVRTSKIVDPVVTTLVRRLNGDEPFGWNATLTQNIKSRNLSWSISANGGDKAKNHQPRTVSFYDNEFTLNANVSWRPRPDVTLSGGVNNILQGDDYNGLTFYTAPRNVGVPLYFEESLTPGTRAVYVTLRKSFL